jgi:hypothetical protein
MIFILGHRELLALSINACDKNEPVADTLDSDNVEKNVCFMATKKQ